MIPFRSSYPDGWLIVHRRDECARLRGPYHIQLKLTISLPLTIVARNCAARNGGPEGQLNEPKSYLFLLGKPILVELVPIGAPKSHADPAVYYFSFVLEDDLCSFKSQLQ